MTEAESIAQAILDHLDTHTGTKADCIAALAIVQQTLIGTMRPPHVRDNRAVCGWFSGLFAPPPDRAAGAAQQGDGSFSPAEPPFERLVPRPQPPMPPSPQPWTGNQWLGQPVAGISNDPMLCPCQFHTDQRNAAIARAAQHFVDRRRRTDENVQARRRSTDHAPHAVQNAPTRPAAAPHHRHRP